ncbi:SLIT and NTRK-like protein 1 [Coccinella septempunctata]|uniref:SLIT and NTRK-like protein 1 n=1 Tax=Coccinella septempunctata TaxID=41139 RepID=UPI001D084C08|nr:SLIT and NTRK-like protein 1 [Coccinella septempunctata]
MTVHKLSCTYDPSEERSLFIQKTDIKTLDLSGSMINEVVRSSIREYGNLEELSLSNCRIKRLENGTFADLQKLIKLNLSDNLLTTFNGHSFERMSSLNIMILSNNLLETLSDMHLEAFPKLKVLDISGNQLQSLPEEVMYKIQNDPAFSLYAGNNPWNCNSIIWKKYFERNEELKKKFCSPVSHSFLGILKDREGRTIMQSKTTVIRESCGFVKCKWWIIGSVWIGVILGNLNKLNKLLYQSRCRKKKVLEKSVGTEAEVHHLLRQERVALGVEETELKSKN